MKACSKKHAFLIDFLCKRYYNMHMETFPQ